MAMDTSESETEVEFGSLGRLETSGEAARQDELHRRLKREGSPTRRRHGRKTPGSLRHGGSIPLRLVKQRVRLDPLGRRVRRLGGQTDRHSLRLVGPPGRAPLSLVGVLMASQRL